MTNDLRNLVARRWVRGLSERPCAVAVIMGMATSSAGCATVFDGTKQNVRITSVPLGADVRVDGRYLGQTPLETTLDRERSQNVRVSQEGYVEQQVQLRKQSSTGWFVWDMGSCIIPVTLCVPVVIDAISGAWFHFDNEYRVKLDRRVKVMTPPIESVEVAH